MSRNLTSEARGAERRAEHEAERAAANPALEFVARAGWVVKGLLYLAMGVLAFGLALGRSGAADQHGTLKFLTGIAGNFWGGALLGAIAVALAGYSAWSLVCAAFDPLGRDRPGAPGRRLAYLGGGLAYATLLLFCLQLMFGMGGESSDQTVPRVVAFLLSHPFGTWLAGFAGVLAIGGGLGQVVQAFRSDFRKDVQEEDMTENERRAAILLGRLGSSARGVVFIVLGWFVVQAAIRGDPHEAKGLGAAFGTLAGQPFGRVLLAAVALGLIALALYSILTARWMRQPGAARRR